jgi:uncharacterized alpha-E superfamily protein
MLSRTADSLYWLSRYIERAENLARILDLAQRLAVLPSAYAGVSNEWESAVSTAACTETFKQVYDEVTRENVIDFIVASEANPSSIKACIEIARTNARAVRTAMTGEMWEIINGAWHELQGIDLTSPTPARLSRILTLVKEASLRFDGAAYRTMLRTDHFYFQRLGTLIERADSIALLIDVKYHVLLPDKEQVGGGLDYFQWSSILRSVSALTSFHWVYRENVRPWLVADFMILRKQQPRSLISCCESINTYLDQLAEAYGRQGAAQRISRSTLARMENANIDGIFQGGLHEFLTDFIAENNRLGSAIAEQYLS